MKEYFYFSEKYGLMDIWKPKIKNGFPQKGGPMGLKEEILDAAIDAFNEKGAKLTLADISKHLKISKKTIYTVYSDKETLLKAMIDTGFQTIKDCEKEIYHHPTMDTLEKIRQIIIVLPDRYKQIDFRKFITIKEKYPKLYKSIQGHIESGWELTETLLRQGVEEGVVRDIPIPILRCMIEASIEKFLEMDLPGYVYTQNLETMMDILLLGIVDQKRRETR